MLYAFKLLSPVTSVTSSNNLLALLHSSPCLSVYPQPVYACPSLSDHHAILSVFSVPSHSRFPRITKLIRNTKLINVTSFSNDIFSSCLHSFPPLSLSSYLQLFSSTVSRLMDKHAPLKTVSCSSNTRKPFITDSILKQKSPRSNLNLPIVAIRLMLPNSPSDFRLMSFLN